MPNDVPEMQFPVQGATSCPHCKSVDKLGKKVFDELVRMGRLQPSDQWGLKSMVPTGVIGLDILTGNQEMLFVGVEWEICGKCFTMYATNILPKTVPMPKGMVAK